MIRNDKDPYVNLPVMRGRPQKQRQNEAEKQAERSGEGSGMMQKGAERDAESWSGHLPH